MTEQGTYIKVRVKTNAPKEHIDEKDGTYHISIKEKPQRGRANAQVQTLLARTLKCNPKQLRLVKGHTTPSKLYLLT